MTETEHTAARSKLNELVGLLKTSTASYALYPPSRHIKSIHRANLTNVGCELPSAIDTALMATHLTSRMRGFVQGGFFGLCLGFVAMGFAILMQYWGVPMFLYGFIVGGAVGLCVARVVHKNKYWKV